MAYKNFDPRFDVKFSTYAYSYILGEMKKVINDNTLKYGKQLLSLKYKIDKVLFIGSVDFYTMSQFMINN